MSLAKIIIGTLWTFDPYIHPLDFLTLVKAIIMEVHNQVFVCMHMCTYCRVYTGISVIQLHPLLLYSVYCHH